LRPPIFFSRVVALGATRFGRLDGLTIEDAGTRRVLAIIKAADVNAEDVVDLLPEALIPPGVEVVGDGLPGGEIMWEHPPGTARAGEIEDGVDDLLAWVSAVSSGPAGGLPLRREQVLDIVPLEVGQITGVSLSGAHIFMIGAPGTAREDQFLDGH
jgi:hypothetical protein